MKCQRCWEPNDNQRLWCDDCEEEFLESTDDLETKFEKLLHAQDLPKEFEAVIKKKLRKIIA